MRYLIIQSNGIHDGSTEWKPNWFLRECYSLSRALHDEGHYCDIWGRGHANFSKLPDFEIYDAVILAENYESEWLPDLSKVTCCVLHWIIDLHCNSDVYYGKTSISSDVILHATRSLMGDYSKRFSNKRHLWFPNAIDRYYFDKNLYPEKPRSGIVYIGSIGGRRSGILKKLSEQGILNISYGDTGFSYIDKLLTSKAQFNKNIGVDFNYRNFETIAIGACLITERHECMEDLGFKDGVNCLCYTTDEEALELIDRVNSGMDVNSIAEKGYELSKKHSYAERVKCLHDLVITGSNR